MKGFYYLVIGKGTLTYVILTHKPQLNISTCALVAELLPDWSDYITAIHLKRLGITLYIVDYFLQGIHRHCLYSNCIALVIHHSVHYIQIAVIQQCVILLGDINILYSEYRILGVGVAIEVVDASHI